MNNSDIKISPIQLKTTRDEPFSSTPYKVRFGHENGSVKPLLVNARLSLTNGKQPENSVFILDSGMSFPVMICEETYKKIGSPELKEFEGTSHMINGQELKASYFSAILTIGKISFDTDIFINSENQDLNKDFIGNPIFNLFSIYIGRQENLILPRMDIIAASY